MKKIVIIGAGDFQNPLIEKAKEMGFETHVFAWQDGSVGEKTADFFYPISIVEKEKILEECRKIEPSAVVTIASDLANITVQYLSKELGLLHNSDECIENTTNKYKMRQALKSAGVSTPEFASAGKIDELNLSDFKFPLIVKPTDRSGSRGITKVTQKEQLPSAIFCSSEQSFEKRAIVEEFIEGDEYSCECISFEGTHTVLAVTKKFTTGAPNFIETGHMEPPNLSDDMISRVKSEIVLALDALDIKYGASHSEFRITPEGDIKIIEIGSRMGGDCIGSHLVEYSTGYDFLGMVIDTAYGKAPDFTKKCEPSCVAIRFVFDSDDIRVLEKIRKNEPKALAYVSEIEPVNSRKIVDSGTRLGFFIAKSRSCEELINLMELHNGTN